MKYFIAYNIFFCYIFNWFCSTNPTHNYSSINLKIENDIIRYIIEEGYHSYSTFERAQYRLGYSDLKIIECIIPKDSEYYVNSRQEIVSSNIIVTDKILNYL